MNSHDLQNQRFDRCRSPALAMSEVGLGSPALFFCELSRMVKRKVEFHNSAKKGVRFNVRMALRISTQKITLPRKSCPGSWSDVLYDVSKGAEEGYTRRQNSRL